MFRQHEILIGKNIQKWGKGKRKSKMNLIGKSNKKQTSAGTGIARSSSYGVVDVGREAMPLNVQ